MSLGTSSPPRILINGSPLDVVDKFSYLGSIVNSSNNLDDEIHQRIGKASTNFGRLSSRVWKNHHLTIKIKIKVYTACILGVLLYSSETWCTYRRQENRLNAFHFRCLRSILGVSWSYMNHVPNSTILHLTGSYDLTTIIRQRRLHWLGQVHRMEDGRLPKDILYGEFYNAPCRIGRPKHCSERRSQNVKWQISSQNTLFAFQWWRHHVHSAVVWPFCKVNEMVGGKVWKWDMVTMAQVPLGYAHDGVIAKFSIFEHFFVKAE